MSTRLARLAFSSLAAAILLSGCVLQSEKPLLKESQGAPALKTLGSRFLPWTFDKGVWSNEDQKEASFVAKGQHYEFTDENGRITVMLFVPLGGPWFALQMREIEKPAAYVLAELKSNEMIMHPLMCEELQKDAKLAKRIRFENSDCYAPADFSLADLKALTAHPPLGNIKIVPVK
jgi:hypothetical protein